MERFSVLRRLFRRTAFLADGVQERGRLEIVSVIGAYRAMLRFQSAAQQTLGFVKPSSGTKERGEVAGRAQGVDIVTPQDPAFRRETATEEQLSLIEPAKPMEGAGQISKVDKGIGVVGTADLRIEPHAFAKEPLGLGVFSLAVQELTQIVHRAQGPRVFRSQGETGLLEPHPAHGFGLVKLSPSGVQFSQVL